ncbi:unnamed protein product [Rotaria socialis]|uniref:Uncharacterized protein n=1 Tax=Rotaria socialis TaxID=392032 RepID=A0A817YU32_9BILA|nr:unnamed protein product [Rotaria socialis]CAF3386289.1 unnamed protein product [Rotaria socialis]CAF3435671.1 unnamed protein product [Rotaria socialis]CAF3710370.1 unnamed protein product [Rotaria socialis]CAF4344781.1 unnamed protein product [Rotaria socialis]
MLGNDVSYLYSNDFLALSLSNKKELNTKLLPSFECRSVRPHACRLPTQTLETGHRTEHIILFRDETIVRDKQRRKKNKTIQESLNEQSTLEHHLTKLQLCEKDFHTKINNVSTNSLTNLFLMDKQKSSALLDQYSADFDHFSLPITNILKFNNNMDDDMPNS